MSRRAQAPRGFTLIELLVVTVLGSLVLLAAHKTLVTNLRAFTIVSAEVRTREPIRAAAEVLRGELREISPSQGDLIAMTADSLVIRGMRKMGTTCGVVVGGTSYLTVTRMGAWFEVGDAVVVLADNETRLGSDDTWLTASVSDVDTTLTCAGGRPAQRLALPGTLTMMTDDVVQQGAPVRAFTRYWFGLVRDGDEWYLARREPGKSVEPMVGPLEGPSTPGLMFAYFDAFGATTATPTQVARIDITLRSESEVLGPDGRLVGDSVVATIYPRN
jgi:prepilin-type N-terminal cleavage/methylation domain-containing protein